MNEIIKGIKAASLTAVTTDADGTGEGRFLFPEGFVGFAGHFPGFPILPAVVQVMAAIYVAGEAKGERQRLVALQEARFLNPVHPGQELVVGVRSRVVKGRELIDAKVTAAGTTAATLLLELAPDRRRL